MAIALVNQELSEEARLGDFRIGVVNFKGDTSYVNPGGRPGVAAVLGYGKIVAMIPLSHAGYIWEYNPATDSIKVWQQPGVAAAGASPEVPNATNLAALTYRALVIAQ